ncbi:urease accessory protein UreH domain-containing protein [Gelidibacter salicanalis]|uniref:Sulfite exporter TauE/SafE family protein n=1 Tax=Gelidibacter salicanalis TaxID=291193 RepID=A0A934NKR7_9FLAO|nr:sulfite exporter TauE/SafE family protein [Gelidibacter salicanalis]MBJ7882002.1 sulfite exporter TauE/SafE family protein [Gelidibacter salicanalis]
MMNMSLPFIAGTVAATLHVLSGPDHLAAVAPFAIERVKKAWKVGMLWGVGHLSGMLLIGVLFLLFKDLIPIEEISKYSEKLVGFVLILLGIWIFVKILRSNKKRRDKHIPVHSNDNPLIHGHEHSHEADKGHFHDHKEVRKGNVTTYFVGLVHGLAGIAHFLLFLPVIGFASKTESVKYIFGFGVGTLLTMTIFAVVMGRIVAFSKRNYNQHLFQGIHMGSAVFAFLFGIYWVMVN